MKTFKIVVSWIAIVIFSIAFTIMACIVILEFVSLPKKCSPVVKVGSCTGGCSGSECRVEVEGGKKITTSYIVMVGDEVCWYD